MSINYKPRCQVCFFEPSFQSAITQLIACTSCKRSAHKFCYLPNCNDKAFTCDACNRKAKKPVCYICGNDGLLKVTNQGDYGHPVCLMFNRQTVTGSYSSLNFYTQKGKRKSKMGKCSLCENSCTQLSDLFKCYEIQCNFYGHYYCILKDQGCKNFEQEKWVQDLRILDSNYINYFEIYLEKIKRYTKKASPIYYKSIFGDRNIRQEISPAIVFCNQHSLNLANCICVNLQQSKQQRNWILCDNCGRWYHFQCQQLVNEPKQDKYKCKCCTVWQNKIKDNKIQPITQNFPKLHFYDLVYIQYFSENKLYRLSNSMIQLLKRVPFTCSIKYFNQFIKNKQISQKLLKCINFMKLKEIIKSNGKNKKQNSKNKVSHESQLNNHIWKLDFLVNNEPLQVLNKAKNQLYKMDQIPNILLKFYKKYSQGSNILKPLIKQAKLLKQQIQQQKEGQSQVEQNQISNSDIKNSIQLLRGSLQNLKHMQYGISIKKFQEKAQSFYHILQSNQLLNEVCKNYLEEKRIYYSFAESIFLYDDVMDMVAHSRLQQMFFQYTKFSQLPQLNQDKMMFAVKRIKQIYNAASKKVQHNISNETIIRQVNCQCIRKEQNDKDFGLENKKQKQIEKNKFKIGLNLLFMSQKNAQIYLEKHMKNQWINNLLLSLELNQHSINQLYSRYKNYNENVKDQSVILALKNYVKLYECAKILSISITEGLIQEVHNQNTDYLNCIKSVKIDKSNIYKFCTFFISIRNLNLNKLQPKLIEVIKQKGIQFLNLIAYRSMIFQCQIQFKAAAALMCRYNINFPKISDLLQKHKQLLQMLKSVNLQSLQNLSFYDTHLRILQQARQFCLQNDLQFRISKIQYMIKLYQCKEEAFKYFPAKYIIKDITLFPSKFARYIPKITVDYYLLKKFIYKLKLLKFPTDDHMYESLNQLYANRQSYFTTLSDIISTYNENLEAEPGSYLTTKFSKKDIINLIQQKHSQFVSCKPEEQQILILINEHNKSVKKLQKYIKSKQNNQVEGKKIYKQLMVSPFQIQNKVKYENFFAKMSSLIKKTINIQKQYQNEIQLQVCDIIQNMPTFLKKTQLDQTSARGQHSSKSLKPMQKLIGQINMKPRAISIQEVCKKYKNMKNYGEIDEKNQYILNSYLQKCEKIQKNYEPLLIKFKKGQRFDTKDMELLQKLKQDYQKQNLRMQMVQNISSNLKQFDLKRENKQEKSYNSSASAISSKNSFKQDSKQVQSTSKTKKVKIILQP